MKQGLAIGPLDVWGPLKVRLHSWGGRTGYLAQPLLHPQFYAAGKSRISAIGNLGKKLAAR